MLSQNHLKNNPFTYIYRQVIVCNINSQSLYSLLLYKDAKLSDVRKQLTSECGFTNFVFMKGKTKNTHFTSRTEDLALVSNLTKNGKMIYIKEVHMNRSKSKIQSISSQKVNIQENWDKEDESEEKQQMNITMQSMKAQNELNKQKLEISISTQQLFYLEKNVNVELQNLSKVKNIEIIQRAVQCRTLTQCKTLMVPQINQQTTLFAEFNIQKSFTRLLVNQSIQNIETSNRIQGQYQQQKKSFSQQTKIKDQQIQTNNIREILNKAIMNQQIDKKQQNQSRQETKLIKREWIVDFKQIWKQANSLQEKAERQPSDIKKLLKQLKLKKIDIINQ